MINFKDQVQELKKYFLNQYENEKHRYESLDHFVDLNIHNLNQNTNFTPEEMPYEVLKAINERLKKLYEGD